MVSPPVAHITAPIADMRASPDPLAELVDQLHYREAPRVLGSRGDWWYVQAEDHYFGWIEKSTASARPFAGELWLSTDEVVRCTDLPQRPPTADDLIATAEAFVGVPYLWGGTTALGMDCSGYVQQVYRLNGIRLDRDADQQATEGRPVEEARAGDLLFFGDVRVTHVGMSIGNGTFFHAPQKGPFVERGTQGGRTLRAIRRYLPDPG